MSTRLAGGVLALVAAFLAAGVPAWGQLPGIKVTTDRSIDCSSFRTIARDLMRDKDTEEAKAIAAWYFVRRMIYHWPHPSGAGSKEIDWINSSGYGLCGAQSMAFVKLCRTAGLKAGMRYMPGHVTAEVFYGGQWHFFDCQVGWFAWKKDKSAVAGIADMVRDPTLITKAVANGTGSVPFMQCRDKAHLNGRAVGWVQKARGVGRGGTRVTGKIETAKLTLLEGMTYTRCWYYETDPKTGKPHRSLNRSRTPTHHGCPPAYEKDDSVDYPFWEPYLVEGDGNAVRRTYGNGRLVYRPDLASASFRAGLAADGFAGMTVAKAGAGPKVHPAEAGEPGVIILPVRTPYYFAGDAWIDGEFVRNTAEDANRIHVSTDQGKTWKLAWENDKLGANRFEGISLHDAVFGRWRGVGDYLIKIELGARRKPTDAGLNALSITHVFVNNIHSLPYLVSGRNRVRVTADKAAKLAGGKLLLTYCWWEQGKPRKDRIFQKQITALPFECDVVVDTKKLPRMRYVRLEMTAAR
jgi:hypothetical protein